MDTASILSHMNEHHQQELHALTRAFSGETNISDVHMVGVDTKGMDVTYNNGTPLRIPFLEECTPSTIKDAIIAISKSVKQPKDNNALAQEIEDFKASLASVMIASLAQNGHVVSSYAPIIRYDGKLYVYISEIADHYASISANPENIEISFIEDESKTKTILARRRLKYKIKAHAIKRDTEEFNKVLDHYEQERTQDAIKTIRSMTDFHLIWLEPLEGRYVKGFAQAYNISANGEVSHVGGGMPHKTPHK